MDARPTVPKGGEGNVEADLAPLDRPSDHELTILVKLRPSRQLLAASVLDGGHSDGSCRQVRRETNLCKAALWIVGELSIRINLGHIASQRPIQGMVDDSTQASADHRAGWPGGGESNGTSDDLAQPAH